MSQVRVPRKGITTLELAEVLALRLGAGFEVAPEGHSEVIVRRSAMSAAVVRIRQVPGATVFRVHGAGVPLVSSGTARVVVDALRRSPEFRSI